MLNFLLDIKFEYIHTFLLAFASLMCFYLALKLLVVGSEKIKLERYFIIPVIGLIGFILIGIENFGKTDIDKAYIQKFSLRKDEVFTQKVILHTYQHRNLGFFICNITEYKGSICLDYLNYLESKIV